MLGSRPDLRVVAFDRDATSIEVARRRLQEHHAEGRVQIVRGDFRHAPDLLRQPPQSNAHEENGARQLPRIDGALVDAGMSLWQVSDAGHGLSFRLDSPLDMRYDRLQAWSAFDLVNRAAPSDLEDVLFSYTDESWARRIVEFVVAARRVRAIEGTIELAGLVEAAIPAGARRGSKAHAATKTFAALRLAVNTEYWALDEGARALCSLLAPGARLVVLTYSSHEDRIIKRLFRRLCSRSMEEPPGLPAMPTMPSRAGEGRRRPRSQGSAALSARAERGSLESLPPGLAPLEPEILGLLKLPGDPEDEAREDAAERALRESGWGQSWIGHAVTRRPIEPSPGEIESNPLARSCKLRAIEKRLLDAAPAA